MTPVVLTPQVAALGIALGLVFSLVGYLTTNLSPGGMITPGWLSLTLIQDWQGVGLVAGISLLTYLLTRALQRFVILYGKRQFAAVVLTGVVLQAGLSLLLAHEYPLLYVNQTLGFIVPGLIAYQFQRQPKVATLLSTTAVTLAVYIVLMAGLLLGALPTD
ncbi:poly-gamma-glutamate biosynthesis protein PgsC/CapC [Streptomyces umbrinus]|uniref:poly-gamma-glutamate biosynthesis protein PgsC/CapC n=1 Tax=Streptomyces umbrinus TaxID=67370 RepID=UPI003C2EA997